MENLHVRKGVGEASEVMTRAVNAKRRCLLVLVVEDRVGEERAKLFDVLVGDVVGEACYMVVPGRIPKCHDVPTW